MTSKKNFFAAFVALICVQFANAQSTNWGWDWKDSSKVAVKNLPQYSEFINNAFPYPARPRDKWEIGLGLGTVSQVNDTKADDVLGLAFNISARKSLSHVFSLRPFVSYYQTSGKGDPIGTPAVLGNTTRNDFRNKSFQFGVEGIVSLNTIRSYKGNPKSNIYFLIGPTLIMSNTERKNNTTGNYEPFYVPGDGNLISTFGDKNAQGIGKTTLGLGLNVGGGIAFKITDNFNLGVELKSTLTNNDYYDAFTSTASNSFDHFNALFIKGNFNLGNSSKRVQPLWWINPNNYVYNELNAPQHMKMKKPVLDDADKDGIADQFDLEPNSPAGADVDAHGRAVDTDGDGIPDFKDKEKLTQQRCFPVNNEGVGTCPPDACCTESKEKISELQKLIESAKFTSTSVAECSITSLPSISFKSGGAKLNRESMSLLDAVAVQMRNNPSCKVKVLGHPESNKSSQQKAYDRVEAIIKYLVEKQGIAESRFIFAYEGGNGDSNTVDLMGTTEEGPNTVPAPHPQLKGKQNY